MKSSPKQKALVATSALLLTPIAHAVDTQADVSGLFAYSISQFDSDVRGTDTDAENNASSVRLHAQASEDGYSGFVVYERGLDRFNSASLNNEQQDFVREFFGGIGTQYGTVSYGRRSTFYKLAARKVDPFYDTSTAGFDGQFANEGGGYGLSNLSNGFVSNTVAYEAPVLHGLSFHAAAYLNDNGDAQARAVPGTNDHDDYAAGLLYQDAERGFAVGVEYLDINSIVNNVAGADANVVFGVNKPAQSEAVRVYGAYTLNALSLGASFEQIDVEGEADARQYMMLSATYAVVPKLRLALSYGLLKDVVPNAVVNPDGLDGDGFTAGAFYEVFENLTTYVAGRMVNLDSGDDTSTIAAGMAFRFKAGLTP